MLLLPLQGCGREASVSPEKDTRRGVIPEVDLISLPEAIRKDALDAQARARSSPFDPAAVGDLGIGYFAHDFPRAAAACLGRAANLDPNRFRWRYYEGLALERVPDAESAIEAYEKARDLDGTYAPALVHLANLLLEKDHAR